MAGVVSRRAALVGAASTLVAPCIAAPEDIQAALSALETRIDGRLGVAIFETGAQRMVSHRGDERFPLCSTFKVLAAAFILTRIDRGEESLARQVIYSKSDLVAGSPVTEAHTDSGLTVAQLCEAAITRSDNTAGNLMLASFGGPAGLTAFLGASGDPVTRLDRRETALNEAAAGDPRDTTTPNAMLSLLRRFVLQNALTPASRERLAAWLVASKTGDARLKAGVPAAWRVGDKTGTGDNGATNDVAIFWPPARMPIVVTAYFVGSRAPVADRNVVLAEVGRIAAAI